MDELTSIRTFLRVVESGSFSSVARQQNTTASSIARHIDALEKNLGVRLLNRTTRAQSMTEVGQMYHNRMVEIVRKLDNINSYASAYQSEIKGVLKVQLRTSIATEVIIPQISKFLDGNPDLRIDIELNDEQIDLVKNQIDVAVWLGKLEDSNIIARQLSSSNRVVCSSPDYFREHGEPVHPTDLKSHNCLVYSATNYESTWRFIKGSEVIKVDVSGNLKTDHSTALMKAALHGVGIAVVPEWVVKRAIEQGDLRVVLQDFEVKPTEQDTALYAVFPHGQLVPPKTRAFVDFLVSLFSHNKLKVIDRSS
ncbi:LysR family transcriptional regulator [Sneathiella sp. HT1-7]|uniref:LysR family transcriptional regulator n=1 Tax=Sneathiella sp. HT1-7 TaxID=2887192 RepID=UPI001D156752|nr:LysR family transcriptional regulator [Sneathiella sp. HT1-7]MCC3304338.1 LysR family transcriptional regulator [Sneathiella sp. HT1-7]